MRDDLILVAAAANQPLSFWKLLTLIWYAPEPIFISTINCTKSCKYARWEVNKKRWVKLMRNARVCTFATPKALKPIHAALEGSARRLVEAARKLGKTKREFLAIALLE